MYRQLAASKDDKCKDSRLLALPGELRTKIYEFCLLEPDLINIDSNPVEPALLSVNRQMRKEARPLYYNDNNFSVPVIDYNDELLCKFYKRSRDLTGTVRSGSLILSGNPNWTNLMRWCENIWRAKSTGLDRHEDGALAVVLYAAHEIAYHHRELQASWEACEKALANLKLVVQTLDPRWK